MIRDYSSPEDKKWIEKGVDIWLIRDNLKLSYEERIEQHQNTLNCIDELKQLRFDFCAKHSKTS